MSRPTELILVPYSLGRESTGMGAGPLALREDVADVLRPDAVVRLALSEPFGNPGGTSAEDATGGGTESP